MPRRGSSKPPAEPVVKPYGCDLPLSKGYRIFLYATVVATELVSAGRCSEMISCWICGCLLSTMTARCRVQKLVRLSISVMALASAGRLQ